jgi:EAL domain-containing protein (putative c-di-GMP-specific phosphodiesterase class I)
MRCLESGKGTAKAIFALAFLAAVGFSCIKIIPVYVNNYQLHEYIQNQTPFWLTQRASVDAIRSNILGRAQELGLPVAAEQVNVEASANRVSVNIDYTVPVDLKVYTLRLHFTPSSENRSI